MELEKTLYRIHDRILSSNVTQRIIKYGSYLFLGLAAVGIVFFILLNINQQFRKFDIQTQMNNETIYIFNVTDAELKAQNESYLSMKFSEAKNLLLLSGELINKYNFTVETIFIESDNYFGGLNHLWNIATNIETRFLVDLINSDFNTTYIINQATNESWAWENMKEFKSNNIQGRLYKSAYILGQTIIGLFLASVIASIYIKMTIICAPVLIVMMMDCMNICGNHEIQLDMLARAFPWMGHYLNILNRNNKLKSELLNSFAYMLLLFYLVYLCSVFSGSGMLFNKSFPSGLSEDFFGLIALNEFASMLFLRTRTSLYFVPKFLIILNLLFLIYFESTQYGFYYLAFQIQLCLSLGIFCTFLAFVEYPALTWSPLSPYTPSIDRPRAFYTPIFHMNWVNDIPQFWSMFYPLYGRRYFQIQHLALVDKNFPLLNNLLNQEFDQPNPVNQGPVNQVPVQIQQEQEQPNANANQIRIYFCELFQLIQNMDLECLLFRIHKSILSLPHSKRIVKHIFQMLLAIIFLMLIHFIVLNLNDKAKQSCLDNIGNYESKVEFPKLDANNTFTNNETVIHIIIGDVDNPMLKMKYSKQFSLLMLNDKMVEDHNVTHNLAIINESCYYSSFIDSLLYTKGNLEILVVGDIMKKMKQVKGWHFLKDQTYNNLFVWAGEEEQNQETDKTFTLIFKMFRFGMRCFFYIFFQTCYASLIIKIIQFGLPVIMNAGWYRLYQRILINNNKGSPQMMIGYVLMFIVFTQIYQSRTFMTILYYNPVFISIQKEVLLVILFNELMSNLFFRTRSTLYYAPKYIIIYYILFFLYFEGTQYGYYQPLINILWLTCISTILAFLYFYEIPAIQEWNQDSFYTPKLTRPRTFYFPLTQTEWSVDLPQLWTMFYPLYGRRFFQVQNLALVDDNQELLNNYLNGNGNGNGVEQLV